MTIKVHFDGRVIVPDEPVDLPTGQSFEIVVNLPETVQKNDGISLEERLRRLERTSGCIRAPAPSAESLRRENMYEERI